MIKTSSAVIYKNTVAVVLSEAENNKYTIKIRTSPATKTKPAVFDTLSVRAKDIVLLDEGPVSSLEAMLKFAEEECPLEDDAYSTEQEGEVFSEIKECHELLIAESSSESGEQFYSFEDLTSLFRSEKKSDEAWGLFCALKNTVFFVQSLKDFMTGKLVFSPRSQEEIDTLVLKAGEKEKEARARKDFIERLKTGHILSEDSVYMTDIEALALGKTDKSRSLHEADLKETPEMAHRLLLETGVWDVSRNPHPLRWGLSMKSSSESLMPPPNEERLEVPGVSFAIDNAHSEDPDDSVFFDGKYLWVHIADPASEVKPDSDVERAARARGATLYIPEGAVRMLCETSLSDYALGLKETSLALSFRLLLDDEGGIEDCSVFKTKVRVKRLTYEEADESLEGLGELFFIARRNIERRKKAGAININIPEVNIFVDPVTKKVSIEKALHPESSDMVREMMLLAGEGAARFAFKNGLPFPFVSQEEPTIPPDLPSGLAGQFRLRRCMRKRSVGVTPSMHFGLGLSFYSQVTSPLRRYSDLLAHIQLRSFLDGREPLDKDTLLEWLSEGDAGYQAAVRAERKSNMHWTLVFLLQNPDWKGEAICVDNTARIPQFFIPSLALESFFDIGRTPELNETVFVKAKKIDIAEQIVDFVVAS